MLLALKSLLCLCLSALPALADACCNACASGHVCASENTKTPQESQTATQTAGLAERYPQLLVFVSFSMPLATLKALATQVNRVGGAIVFRGLVDGSFKKTAEKFKELGQEGPLLALIDPTLFTAYKIETVPTFVLRETSQEEASLQKTHDRLSGNVSLTYSFEQFSKKGDASRLARLLLQKFKQKP